MKFGILADHQYRQQDDVRERLRDLWELTETAATVGLDSIFAINHFVGNLQTPQTISVLANLINHSGDMTVGTSLLILPPYHPVHIAEEFATLDHMSAGRLVLGVGAGYRDPEFEAFAIDKPSRFRKMRESIEVIRAMWTGGPVYHDGEFYQLDGQTIGIRPFRDGGPPIWIGAGGWKAIKNAATYGDAWIMPGNAPAEGWFERATTTYRDALVAAGKQLEPREYPMTINLFVGSDTEEARELVLPYVRDEYFAYAEYPQLAFQRERFQYMWENRFVIGSPDDVAAQLQQYADLGVNHFIARCSWLGFPHETTLESIRLFAEEVMPRFQAAEVRA